ncbi:MAG: hypothetical protein AB1634_19205 [Thermodesulfobacteriota bacterium]
MAEECPECKGIGKISVKTCVKCGGTGQVIIHSHAHKHGQFGHDHPHPHQEPHHPDDLGQAHEHEH